MNITVTKNQVLVNTDYILNDKEYNVNQCYFTFSDEYTDDLVKKAIFVQDTSTIEMSIINNQCQIPAEVLNNGQFELRVYAYEVDGEELLLRYSPSYTTAYVRTGSYIENAESPEVITPTQFEQYMQAMNDGLNEVANVDIDAEQLDNGMSVTITNRYGKDKTVYAYDGEKGETGATPNIQIGTVVTGDHSEVTRTGTNENPIFNFVLEKGDKGGTGNGIASVTKTSTSGLVDTYTITFTNGTTTTFNVTNGKGIASISKTSTSGLTDTYTITYNDNTTSTFEVVNGRGITSINLTSTQDNIDTYTITYNDGTTSTYTVTNSTVTDQEFEELQERTEYLGKYANALIKQNISGTNLTINDTAECPMPIVLSPSELSQETTTGKNIFNVFNIDNTSIITVNADQTITLANNPSTNGFANTNKTLQQLCPDLQIGDNIYVYVNNSNGKNYIYNQGINASLRSYDTSQGASENPYTVNQEMLDGKIIVYGGYQTTDTAKIMISKTPITEYELYTGGQPSPSPDYPQDIHVVTGNNEIKIVNRNLFNNKISSSYEGRATSEVIDTGLRIIETTNIAGNHYVNFNILDLHGYEGKTIRIKSDFVESSSNKGRVMIRLGSVSTVGSGSVATINVSGSTASYTIPNTLEENKDYLQLSFYSNYGGTVSQNDYVDYTNVILTIDNEDMTYTPHQEQSLPLTLGSLEYCKISDYSDVFFKNTTDSEYYDSTLQLNKWYLKKNILKTTDISGSTGITINDMVSNSEIKSYYGGTVNGKTITYNSAISGENTIYYPTTSPQDILLNDTLQSQLEEIYNWVISYQDQTNILQTNDDLPFIISVSACYDLNNLLTRIEILESEV